MPELPDVTVYIERLTAAVCGKPLRRVRIPSPFLLRSVDPPINQLEGSVVQGFSRLGKRIVWEFDGDVYLVLHLMIAGRLKWRDAECTIPKKLGLAAFDFDHGSILLTEAGSKKRASLFCVSGRAGLAAHDRGGLEVMDSTLDDFRNALFTENRTLKRALTNPRLFSGVGNAYSDEILHRARLSPLQLTRNLSPEDVACLHQSTIETMADWTDRLREETGDDFPEKVTAFRKDMAVHGKYRQPCPVCSAPIQRIVYAKHEVNYCARCQTEGRLLADRAFSRLLKKDWPKTLDEWED